MRSAVFIAFFCWMLPAAAGVADLHVEIRVAKSGELTITERTTVLAPEGRQHRQTIHRATRRIEFLADHDALQWRLEGAERITAEIILPEAVPARLIKAEASGRDAQIFLRDGRAAFRSEDGVAIVVRFPKGVVVEPSFAERAQWIFSEHFGAVLIVITLVLTVLTLLQLRKVSTKT
ncbi:MAG TPA: hypothetical protein VFR66_03360 [Burkholderiales bacterium]|nr:hypothetical protein [Burkholderiales bacterium]